MLEAVHTLDNVASGGGCDDADGDMNACATFDVAAVAAARTHVRCEQCWIWSLRSSCGMLLVLCRLLSLFYAASSPCSTPPPLLVLLRRLHPRSSIGFIIDGKRLMRAVILRVQGCPRMY